jgi:hypothetical protein
MATAKKSTAKKAPAKKAAAKKTTTKRVTGATSKTDSFTTASENPKSVTYGNNRRKAGATTEAARGAIAARNARTVKKYLPGVPR